MPMGRRDGVRRSAAEVKQCGRCAFWECMNPRKSSATGLCRYYPPSSRGWPDLHIWPQTDKHDWCGKFEQR